MAQLSIVIVGAGLSGLAASLECALSGHKVAVLESAKELAEVGAGLQLTPNATRLLQRWKVYDSLRACEPSTCTVYNYRGKVLAHEDGFAQNCRNKYGAPFSDCHRVDLQKALVKRAQELGVKVVLGSKARELNFDIDVDDQQSEQDASSEGHHDATGTADLARKRKQAKVTTERGDEYLADLVVAADGLWSICRSVLLGADDAPLPTGDLAYRVVLKFDQMKDDTLKQMVQTPGVRFWIGPDSHAVAYSMRDATMLNLVLLVPDDLDEGVARMSGNLEEMRQRFEGWDPILINLLSCVTSVDKWKLMHRTELPTWINSRSNLVLIGDACHPMLPYLAQGANSSIEDGAVLGLLLHPLTNPSFRRVRDLPSALLQFQHLRKVRGEAIARETFKQRKDFHMRDGDEQTKRDEFMLEMLGGELRGEFPSRWTCPVVQPWLYGYDAVEEVKEAVRRS